MINMIVFYNPFYPVILSKQFSFLYFFIYLLPQYREMKMYTLFFLILSCLFSASSDAAVSVGQEAMTVARHEFTLPFKETGFFYSIEVPLEGKEVTFRKEPAWGKTEIVRGALPAGKSDRDFICFAWNVTGRKLYIDLNRNLDITDDSAGIFTCQDNIWPQNYTGIHLEFLHESVRYHYVIDVTLSGSRKNPYCYVTVRSGWQGVIELYGEKWLLAVVDNLDGVIDRDDALFLQLYDEDDVKPVDVSFLNQLSVHRSLFFDGHNYEISFGFDSEKEETGLRTTFMETHPPLAELTIDGQYIRRLILKESNEKGAPTVILESPGKTVLVPARTYGSQRIIVDGGDSLGLFYADCTNPLILSEEKPVSFTIGGPLHHSVVMTRRGLFLQLRYQLVDSGGVNYRQVTTNPKNMPTFTIYRENKKIASGSFEYG